ncbi:pyridoxal phosphate-dependent decarboxylase family protein [Dongshaea marina]|uniref:pyridoxal phosphate-dependent decarboxylase family protein n=1 Tax=Dongshaea marina TaxID=2047966 RepID=UPI000D3EC7B3|nr:aminotransferase class I/II-fold pyridoxal phosphate-dependent enzyme [Dongshaea marina]
MENKSMLQLSNEQMRNLGYGVVDLLIEHLNTLPEKSPCQQGERASMEQLFREELPKHSQDPMQVLKRVEKDVMGNIMHLDHPRFFAFVPGPGNFVSAMADALASGFNVFSGTWMEAAAPSQIELVTLDWLRSAFDMPKTAGGLFTSGGSAANLTALATARHVKLGHEMERAVAYCSDQTHSSVARAFRILGFRPEQLRTLASDADFKLDPQSLRQMIEADLNAGLQPFCVIANLGTTNTGAVDPIETLASICQEFQLWLHADGAYGGATVLSPETKELFKGADSVDSLSLDPHKWLFQPYEIGCLLVKDQSHLKQAFHILPEYLEDTAGKDEEINFCDYGPQLTRGFRALKLWMSLQVFGADAFKEAIERGIKLAESAEIMIRDLPQWEITTDAQLGVVTFRARPEGYSEKELDAHNQALVEAILEDGYAMIVSTKLRGKTVLRLCTINPRTSVDDLLQTIERLEQLSQQLAHKKLMA